MKQASLDAASERLWIPARRETAAARAVALSALGFGIVAIALLVVAALNRGPWIDEFWTYYLAGGELGLGDALAGRWLLDPHPPLFSALNWLLHGLLPGDVMARRLVTNIVPLLLAFAYLVHCWRKFPALRGVLAVFGVVALSGYPVMNAMTEYRSYLAQACVAFCLLVALLAADRPETAKSHGPGDRILFCLILFLSLNLHYVSAFIAVCVTGAFVAVWFVENRRGQAVATAAAGVVAALPLLAFFVMQRRFMDGLSGNFWIDTDLTKAVLYLGLAGVRGLSSNAVLALGAAAALVLAVHGGAGKALRDRNLRYAATVFAGAAVAGLLLLAVNQKTPIIVDRYLIVLTFAAAAFLAALSAELLTSRPVLFGLFLANALAVVAYTVWVYSGEARWNATARELAAAQRACPGLQIVAWLSDSAFVFANNESVRRLAYRSVAESNRLNIVFEEGGRLPASTGSPCGTAIWLEHIPADFKDIRSADDLAKFLGIAIPAADPSAVRFFTGDSGFILFYGKLEA